MNTVLWVLQGFLSSFFIMPGIGKLSSSSAKYIADGHIKPSGCLLPIRILGVSELQGCLGIILPWLTGIAPVWTPVTAVCFCLIMAAGIVNHTIRKEYKLLPMLVTILAAAGFVAFYRFTMGCSK